MLRISRAWAPWRTAKLILATLPSLVLFSYLYIWRLGSIVPGLSEQEAAARMQSASLEAIKNDPINAPHKLLQYIFQLAGHHGAFWMRSVSVLFVLIFLVSFFLFVRKWFGSTIGYLGMLLFATTPWVIILARNATPDVMYLCPIIILCCYTMLTKSKQRDSTFWFILMASTALALYTPGVIWLVVLSLIIWHKQILKIVSELPSSMAILGITIFILLIVPLFYGCYSHLSVTKHLLLIPNNFGSINDILNSLVWSASALVIKTNQHIDYIVGRLPLLNIAQGILAIIGFYALYKWAKRETLLIAFMFFAGLILASFNQNIVILSFCVLAIVILNTAALRYLCLKWFRVFPLNPIPRLFAIIVIGVFIAFYIAYGIRYSIYAWPHSPSTRKIYMIR
jgi:4-amino-4-deoxy-L-arabinose transferase-like glycosyltransferase